MRLVNNENKTNIRENTKALKKGSVLMIVLNNMGFRSLAWKVRRLYCPVGEDALVLEIGSGGNPYPRADVLCDAYFETSERHFAPLVADRPIVLGFAESLPFLDDSFDFVIASHVLEHSRDPERFISEIQRVAKAGYIEVPDAFMERICPYPMHALEIREKNGSLEIYKKTGPQGDFRTFELFSNMAYKIFPDWIKTDPFTFHVRYYWNRETGGIKYKVINPEYIYDWELPIADKNIPKKGINDHVVNIFRYLFSRKAKIRTVNVREVLACPKCKHKLTSSPKDETKCIRCGINYHKKNGILDLTSTK